jgi:hypothetical protein
VTRAASPRKPFVSVDLSAGRVELHPEHVAEHVRERLATSAEQETARLSSRVNAAIGRALAPLETPTGMAGLAAGWALFETIRAAPKTQPKSRANKGGPRGADLVQGRSYRLFVLVDPLFANWSAGSSIARGRRLVEDALSLEGWTSEGEASLEDEAAARAFYAGEPSSWVWPARWSRPETSCRSKPAWAKMVVAVPEGA